MGDLSYTVLCVALMTQNVALSPQYRCITTCVGHIDGYFQHCDRCDIYTHCVDQEIHIKQCTDGYEWDSYYVRCVIAPSSTCRQSFEENSNEEIDGNSEAIITTTPRPNTTQTQSSTPTRYHVSSTTALSYNMTNIGTPTIDDRDDNSVNNVSEVPYCTEPNQWNLMSCQYIIILSTLAGFLPVIPTILCVRMFCWKSCMRKRAVTIATQTVTENVYYDITPNGYGSYLSPNAHPSDQNSYQEMQVPYYLEPITAPQHTYIETIGDSKVHYETRRPEAKDMPVHDKAPDTTSDKSNDTVNNYLEPMAHQENVYLELCGYSYLNLQEEAVQRQIDKTLAPVVVSLCQTLRNSPGEYKELEEKLQKLTEVKDGGKSSLQVVIDELYQSRQIRPDKANQIYKF